MSKNFEFISIIEACILVDIGYHGHPFSWCNQREDGAKILKTVDTTMINNKWLDKMLQTTINNLPYVGSDLSP